MPITLVGEGEATRLARFVPRLSPGRPPCYNGAKKPAVFLSWCSFLWFVLAEGKRRCSHASVAPASFPPTLRCWPLSLFPLCHASLSPRRRRTSPRHSRRAVRHPRHRKSPRPVRFLPVSRPRLCRRRANHPSPALKLLPRRLTCLRPTAPRLPCHSSILITLITTAPIIPIQ